MKWAYYNDNDKFVCAWLAELMKAGLIMEGEIDSQSVLDVRASDVRGFLRCHFFAGIGGWDAALRLAGWPAGRPVWTASCPCQPLSVAGLGKGHADERHLWPAFCRLVAECEPATLFGEQVASKDGREWLAGIRADLEAMGYACGAADLCAAGVGAPHIRQRLYWMADAGRENHGGRGDDGPGEGAGEGEGQPLERPAGLCSTRGRLVNTFQPGLEGHAGHEPDGDESGRLGALAPRSAWAASVFIPCADGKHRRVPVGESGDPEPRLFPLAANGTYRNRMGLLRGSGNSICVPLAAEFVTAAMEAMP